MFNNYFIFDGKIYHTGAVFIVNYMGKETEATFICHHLDMGRYILKVNGFKWLLTDSQFQEAIVRTTNKIDNTARQPVVKTKPELEIDNMLVGWLWYIFLMAIATVFKGNIFLWIFISIVFFNWRKEKITKEGTYIEW